MAAVASHDDGQPLPVAITGVEPDFNVPSVDHGIEALKDIVFGSTAGILGKYVEYPFDTVKVRLQSQSASSSISGPVDAFKQAFASPEGPIRSLYRGVSAPLFGAAVETSSLFFSYRVAQNVWIHNVPELRRQKELNKKIELPFTALLFCGAASGAFTSMALTPIELVKCKMQVSNSSIPSVIRGIFASQGVRGFWHGQLGTLIRETGGSAAWFGSYEATKIFFKQYQPDGNVKVWHQMVGGAAAGMSYNFIFYPADTIKSRMQTEDAAKIRSTFGGVAKEVWAQQGLKGFYRGCGITVFRSAPSSAIIFTIYEALRKFFG